VVALPGVGNGGAVCLSSSHRRLAFIWNALWAKRGECNAHLLRVLRAPRRRGPPHHHHTVTANGSVTYPATGLADDMDGDHVSPRGIFISESVTLPRHLSASIHSEVFAGDSVVAAVRPARYLLVMVVDFASPNGLNKT
jgi:hypothetical protein